MAYTLSMPAFVLAPVAVESCPRLPADDQPHLSSLAASACEATASTRMHPSALIALRPPARLLCPRSLEDIANASLAQIRPPL